MRNCDAAANRLMHRLAALALLCASGCVRADVCATASTCLANGVAACTTNCPPCIYSTGGSFTCFDPIASGCPFGAPLAVCNGKGIFTSVPATPSSTPATTPSPSATPAPTTSLRTTTAPPTASPLNQTASIATPAASNATSANTTTSSTPSGTIFGVIGCAIATILLLGCLAYQRNAAQQKNFNNSWTSPTTHPSFLMTMDAPPKTKGVNETTVAQRGLVAPATTPYAKRDRSFTMSRSSTSTDVERRDSLVSIQSTSSNGYSQSLFGRAKEVVIGSSVSSSVSSVSSIFEIGRQHDRDVLNDSFITSGHIAEEEDDEPWGQQRDSVVIMDDGHHVLMESHGDDDDDDVFDKSVDDMRETSTSVRLFSECSVLSDMSDMPDFGTARI
ncbi:hypothetical protein SDRG_08219 [Saprolegnia diclina VS20]|uniref:TNFR-Cys domain-containing protein n=1 Tax=Saprolegnia diclina (strain VS20) TaxID=1156394 RepID=T0QH05_SAPDV|nr:hypothetical protein SDRG_08219 [Saprolegnia diclina VS20]EQC34001.1 hypothetical protein SDRG_08219 [Saprolegnia diclina VS20]|eukprot:XP_008612313.1 hypothetical protein SDRG_08219 [Saprolegnia diclina VS20]